MNPLLALQGRQRKIGSTTYTPIVEQHSIASLNDQLLCKTVSDTLNQHYPDWTWGVGMDGGIITIICAEFDYNQCMVIHPDRHTHDSLVAISKTYGGELLERARMRRGRKSQDQYLADRRYRMQRGGYRYDFDR